MTIDQLLNVLTGGNAEETLSARSYRAWLKARAWGWAMHVIDALFVWQEWIFKDGLGHCQRAYLREKERGHLPKDYSK
ncbi:MAG: hypothetical protein ACRCV9_07095 [Burkholderiaceae bacterium]